MDLTIDKTRENGETFDDCFNYLESKLSSHYLLDQNERDECVEAVKRLKRVFRKFHKR